MSDNGDVSQLPDQPEERGQALLERLGIPAVLVNVGVMLPALNFAANAARDGQSRPWRAHGTRNIGGRIWALAQDPRNALTLYAGTAEGGVFRTRNEGDTWEPIGGPEDAFPVGALAVAPNRPNILYVGSGEAATLVSGTSPQSGLGFYRADLNASPMRMVREVGPVPAGGAAPAGAANTYAAIVVDPRHHDRCWIAAHTGLWRREAGPTFLPEALPVLPGLPVNVTDVVLAENWDPAQPDTYRIYAAVAGVGIFRGVFNPRPAPNTTWDLYGAGTIQAAGGSTRVVGSDTRFRQFFRVGDILSTATQVQIVASIESDTQLTLRGPFAAAVAANTAYFRGPRVRASLPATGTAGPTNIQSAGNVVTGAVGSSFPLLHAPGHVILAANQARVVSSIQTNSRLTVNAAFAPNLPAATAYTAFPAMDVMGPGTIGVVGPVVTGAGTSFQNQNFFAAGDVVEILTLVGFNITRQRSRVVHGVQSPTQLTLDTALVPNEPAGARYVRRPVQPDGLPSPSSFRGIRLAICAQRPQHVYALMEVATGPSVMSPVHRSTDGGETWTRLGRPEIPGITGDVSPTQAQCWWNLCLAVHPSNPNLLAAGAVDLHRSTDGGQTWTEILGWQSYSRGDQAQHADQHALLFDGLDRLKLWVANDGGISMTTNVIRGNPKTDHTWRKRSHGILAAQFHAITVHMDYPFMMGGGMQDNGTFVSFGGSTWHLAGFGDGGEMGFETNNPRRFYAPTQNCDRILISTVSPGESAFPTPGPPWLIRSAVNADQAAPNNVSALLNTFSGPFPLGLGAFGTGPFIPILEHHPTVGNLFLFGCATRTGGGGGEVFFTTNGGLAFNSGNIAAAAAAAGAPIANFEQVTALAFGPGTLVPHADWWVGTSGGRLFHAQNAAVPVAAPAWNQVALPGIPVGGPNAVRISRIAVHANDGRYVAVATAGNGTAAGAQGRVFLTNNCRAAPAPGQWRDISGLGGAGAVPLPPCPITSLAFDPSIPRGNPQVLYVGTLVGVFVIRNLPPLPAALPTPAPVPLPAVPPMPGFNPQWQSFNQAPLDRFDPALTAPTAYTRERSGSAPVAGPGSIQSTPNSNEVSGSGGTTFNVTFQRGDIIAASNQARTVLAVQSATRLTVGQIPPAADRFSPAITAAAPYARDPAAGGAITAGVGTVTSSAASNVVTGAGGANFTAFFQVGDMIICQGQERAVDSIASATRLTTRFSPPVGQFPLTLVNDLTIVNLPATPGAAAGSPESQPRQKLIVATYGRGMFECDLAAPVAPGIHGGGPQHRLFIRQYAVEDGLRYPRRRPPLLNAAPAAGTPGLGGDPRMPAGRVLFNLHQAFDIRIDNHPFLFPEETVDGVEFDQQLPVKNLIPGERNFVYVQVHTRGWDRVPNVMVHLYHAALPAASADPFQPRLSLNTNYVKEPAAGGPAVAGAGSIQTSAGSNVVVGSGTQFTRFFRQGDVIRTTGLAPDQVRVVETITDDTHLTVVLRPPAADRFTPPLAGANYDRVRLGTVTAGVGTISSSADSNVVTGAGGCNFTATFRVGDVIATRGLARNQARVVTGVQSTTSMTVAHKEPVNDQFDPSIPAGTSYTREPAGGGAATAEPGTISSVPTSNLVTGVGANFSARFQAGDVIRTTGLTPNQTRAVATVNSATELTTTALPLPDLAANFWTTYQQAELPVPAPPPAAPQAIWRRAGVAAILSDQVASNQPAVARFEWVPPAAAAGRPVALLAVCSSPHDPLPAATPTRMRNLLVSERRAALRVAPVDPFTADFFVRQGVDDDGMAGSVAFGGRSPDIIVVQTDPRTPEVEFRDLNDPRLGDRLRGNVNVIYVRVHNRKQIAAGVDVRLFWAKPHVARSAAEDHVPPFDHRQWEAITPIGTATNQSIPGNSWGLVRMQWDNPPDPDPDAAPDPPFRSALLIALINSSDNLDPLPVQTRVTDLASFWDFFRVLADSNNVAVRAIRYEP